jgi:hypothetical protein
LCNWMVSMGGRCNDLYLGDRQGHCKVDADHAVL